MPNRVVLKPIRVQMRGNTSLLHRSRMFFSAIACVLLHFIKLTILALRCKDLFFGQ